MDNAWTPFVVLKIWCHEYNDMYFFDIKIIDYNGYIWYDQEESLSGNQYDVQVWSKEWSWECWAYGKYVLKKNIVWSFMLTFKTSS